MEDIKIIKERTHLYAPNINISMSIHISNCLDINTLNKAVDVAVKNNEMLSCRVNIDDEGNAYYVKAEPKYSFKMFAGNWKDCVKQQAIIPFDFVNGELIRFFAQPEDDGTRLLIITHHIAGDGLSVVYLIDDIMMALSCEDIMYKPLQLCSNERVESCKLNPIVKLMVKSVNKKWDRSGQSFTYDEYISMFNRYWTNRTVEAYTQTMDCKRLDMLICKAKGHGITLNSVIVTALIKSAEEKSDVGMAVNMRPNEYRGMANHATGISIIYSYDNSKSFWENACRVHKLIYNKLNNPSLKFFLIKFMAALRPTLIDAAYFSAFGEYQNKTAKSIQNMFGYNGNPKGISVTNLGELPLKTVYGVYSITDFNFIPPLIPNAKRLVGIATLGGITTFSFCVEKNKDEKQSRMFFEKAINFLRSEAE